MNPERAKGFLTIYNGEEHDVITVDTAIREEIPIGATLFQKPDGLTEPVITRHLVLG